MTWVLGNELQTFSLVIYMTSSSSLLSVDMQNFMVSSPYNIWIITLHSGILIYLNYQQMSRKKRNSLISSHRFS